MLIFKATALGQIVLLAALLFPGQDASWVINLPGAPMFLKGDFPGAYILKNTSGKQVVSFTLGCVVMKKQRVAIISTLPRKDFSIDPGGSFDEAVVDVPYVDQYKECVMKQKAKLALISVTFEDKTSWSFSESSTEEKEEKEGKKGTAWTKRGQVTGDRLQWASFCLLALAFC